MRIVLLGNPAAGSGRGHRRVHRAARALRAAGATELDVRETAHVGHARELSAALALGADRVVACGGDGLVSEVAAGMVGGDVPLAIVPAGRGNDLARALDIPLGIDAAARLAVRGRPRSLDVGLAGGRVFLTVAACGLDAEVSRRARVSRLPLPGAGTYVLELLRALPRARGVEARLEHDGGVLTGRFLLVAVANTPTYGGGFRIAPDATPWDGLLDACVVRASSRLRALALFPSVFRGNHARRADVILLRSRKLHLVTEPCLGVEADGEPLAATPASYSCRPAALPVIPGPVA